MKRELQTKEELQNSFKKIQIEKKQQVMGHQERNQLQICLQDEKIKVRKNWWLTAL